MIDEEHGYIYDEKTIRINPVANNLIKVHGKDRIARMIEFNEECNANLIAPPEKNGKFKLVLPAEY